MVALTAPNDYSAVSVSVIGVSAIVLNKPAGASVEFEANGVPCNASSETQPNFFQSACSVPLSGVYTIRADLIDQSTVVDSAVHTSVGLGGVNYVTLGDSNSNGQGDDYKADGTSASGRRIAARGYHSNLEDLLLAADPQTPVIVYNTAVPGHQSVDVLNQVSGAPVSGFF